MGRVSLDAEENSQADFDGQDGAKQDDGDVGEFVNQVIDHGCFPRYLAGLVAPQFY